MTIPRQGGNYNLDGGGRGSGVNPPSPPIPPPAKGANPGGSPGLLTSTGGLFGLTGALYIPYQDLQSGLFYAALLDSNNFDCEEDAFYNFRIEDVNIGRSVDIHKLVLVHRNIGVCRITFGVRVYQPNGKTDKEKFVTKQITKTLGSKNANNKLYTVNFDLVISGERPQVFFSRNANDGPFSLVSLVMVGDAGETILL